MKTGVLAQQGHQRWLKAGAVLLLYGGLLVLHLGIQPYADDLWYIEKARELPFFSLLLDFYMTWSGRVVSNALAFLLLDKAFWLWKLLNPAVLLALCWCIARLLGPKPGFKRFFTVLLLLLLLGPGVLDYSVFWATGSLYYLWPVTAALWLLQPFFDLLRQEGPPRVPLFPLRLLVALLACMCNEQLAACILGFMGAVLAWWLVKNKKLPVRHALLVLPAAAGTAVLFAAPGNSSRYLHESYQYYLHAFTGFPEVPLAEKLSGGVTWMYGMLFGVLYVTVLLLFGLVWYRRYGQGGGRLRWPLFGLLCLSLAVGLYSPVEALFTFGDVGGALQAGGWAQLAAVLGPYLYWTVFLAALIYMLLRQNWFYGLCIAAALCTLIVMFFSPTIYFSGERTLFIAGVIMVGLSAAFIGKRCPMPLLVLLGCMAAVSVVRLASRILIFY